MGEDPMRDVFAAAWGRLVAVDMEAQGGDLVEIGLGNADLAAAVDHARGHMHQDIEGNGFLTLRRTEVARQQRSQLVADTLDGVQRAKQRREAFGAGQQAILLWDERYGRLAFLTTTPVTPALRRNDIEIVGRPRADNPT